MSSAAEQEAVQDQEPVRGQEPVPVPVADPDAVAAVRAEVAQAQRADAVRSGAAAPAVWPGAPMPLGARFRVGPDGVAGTN
ncbi:glycogen debranching enzyme GlgX, partial [Streptomyces sp. ID01-9D]|nr:glycogen debranching enzyme GlgX [Streptomyces sp. ID01-9D]